MEEAAPAITTPGRSVTTAPAATFRCVFGPVIDLLYPPACLGCGAAPDGDPDQTLCAACREALPYIGQQRCVRCGHPVGPHAEVRTACPACPPTRHFHQAVAACCYKDVVSEMILKLKYGRDISMVEPLARLLIRQLRDEPFMESVDVVVPVPLFWRGRLKRRFNQAELLARRVADSFSLPISVGDFRRIRRTRPQTALTRTQREENLRGAFRVHRPERLRDKAVLLVDDVVTTCSTAAECSRTLRRAGVNKVYVGSVARTVFE